MKGSRLALSGLCGSGVPLVCFSAFCKASYRPYYANKKTPSAGVSLWPSVANYSTKADKTSLSSSSTSCPVSAKLGEVLIGQRDDSAVKT